MWKLHDYTLHEENVGTVGQEYLQAGGDDRKAVLRAVQNKQWMAQMAHGSNGFCEAILKGYKTNPLLSRVFENVEVHTASQIVG